VAARLIRSSERSPNKSNEPKVGFLLSSRKLTPEEFLAVKRGYWGIENGLHQRLDVSALEDKSRVHNRNSIQVLAMFRRLTVSLACHWMQRQKNVRRATLRGFFDAMGADNARYAFALVSAKRPGWLDDS
jgi:predicted transposase YbfD/YdcC